MVRGLSLEPLLGPVNIAHWCIEGGGGGIDWAIVGGESGKGARQCNVNWISLLVSQCAAAGVPCFVKQLGSWPCAEEISKHGYGINLIKLQFKHPKGGDPNEWPYELRVREFPNP